MEDSEADKMRHGVSRRVRSNIEANEKDSLDCKHPYHNSCDISAKMFPLIWKLRKFAARNDELKIAMIEMLFVEEPAREVSCTLCNCTFPFIGLFNMGMGTCLNFSGNLKAPSRRDHG